MKNYESVVTCSLLNLLSSHLALEENEGGASDYEPVLMPRNGLNALCKTIHRPSVLAR